jgi:preprotein translocase subunit SecB
LKEVSVVGHPIQLHDIIVEKISCQRHDTEDESFEKIKLGVSTKVKAKVIDNYQAYVYLHIKIESLEIRLVNIDLLVRGELSTKEAIAKTKLKQFIESNAITLLLPWARQIVYDLSVKMGFPPIMLPTISVFDTIEANKKS